MEYDNAKLQDAVLALLGAFEFDDGRAWKRYAFSVMDDRHKHELITDPRGHREAVHLTEAGRLKARTLAEQFFGAGSAR